MIAAVNPEKTRGIIVKLSSETDFVSKNEDFINNTKKIAEIALKNYPNTLEELLNLPFEGSTTIGEKTTDLVAAIGEK